MHNRTRNLTFVRRCLVLALPLALLTLLALPATTWAHPLGNFTVNRYSRIELNGDQLALRYVLDMAEIPAFQELSIIDANRDGEVNSAEHDAYLAQVAAQLRANLQLALNGTPLELVPRSQELSFPAGQGGLKTLRVVLDLEAQLPPGAGALQARYADNNYAERLGWQEIVVQPHGATLHEASVPAHDISDELQAYPEDLLQSPLSVREAEFRFTPGAATPSLLGLARPVIDKGAIDPRNNDAFTALIAAPTLTPTAMLLALVVAFGLGGAHALAPGHGKTIVAAYLVGTRGTLRHAVFLGLTTTVTHTAGVFALGLITLFVSRFIVPEQLYPWLSVISGVLVFGIGLTLLRGRLRAVLGGPASHADGHGDGGLHSHGDGFWHSHAPSTQPVGWRSLLALGVSGGLLPCPSALVVLLGAISLGRVGFGLLLIVAFSLGLAGVLTLIGVLLVSAGRLFEHIPVRRSPLLRAVPVLSALLIVIAGVGITLQALAQAI
jgi:nickel/cobalt transporter (NicO) family protein